MFHKGYTFTLDRVSDDKGWLIPEGFNQMKGFFYFCKVMTIHMDYMPSEAFNLFIKVAQGYNVFNQFIRLYFIMIHDDRNTVYVLLNTCLKGFKILTFLKFPITRHDKYMTAKV